MTTQCIAAEYGSDTNTERKQPTGGNALIRLLQPWRQWRQYRIERTALKEITSLDDRMLRDIGISRDDVTWAYQLPKSIDATAELEIVARRR